MDMPYTPTEEAACMAPSTRRIRKSPTKLEARRAEAKAKRDAAAKAKSDLAREALEQEARRTAPAGKPKKLHRRKGVDLKSEGVTVKMSPELKRYWVASHGDEKARKAIKALKPATRQKFADEFLRGLNRGGTAYRAFVDEGLTMGEQNEIAVLARRNREVLDEAARSSRTRRTRKPKPNTNQKESDMPAKTSKTRTRKQTTSRKPRRQPVADGRITARDIATQCKTDAKTVRKVLRANGIAKDEATGQYNWPSLKSPAVKRIVKLVAKEVANA